MKCFLGFQTIRIKNVNSALLRFEGCNKKAVKRVLYVYD